MEAPMQQVYRDEEGGINVSSPLLTTPSVGTPRWAEQSSRRKHMRRIAVTSAALFGVYLLFCTWVAFTRRVEATATFSRQEAGSAIGDTFQDSPQLPWPHPPKKPKHPPHHLHPHPPPPPNPTVLACAALPTNSDSVAETTTIDATLPKHAKVVLSDFLLHVDLSVSRTDNQLAEETNLTVAIKTIPAHIPPPMRLKVPKADLEEGADEDNDEEGDEDDEDGSDLYVLCAVTFGHPHHPPHFPEVDIEVLIEESVEEKGLLEERPPHPFSHPPPSTVVVSIFPALNETYPKFPKPPRHHHRHHKMKCGAFKATTNSAPSSLKKAFRSTVSFLFPMFSISPQTSVHGHHHHRPCHPFPRHRFPHHPPPPPPPPPFWVIETKVTLPRFVPVEFGFPFHPRPWFGRH